MRRVVLVLCFAVAGAMMFHGCSLTGSLHKKNPMVGLSQPAASKSTASDTAKLPKFITFIDKDGNEKIVTESVRDSVTGEYMTTVELSGVTVVAKSKNVPERNGSIDVEFIVTVPEILIDNRWALTLTPELIKGDTVLRLNDLVLSGRKFRKQQLKDYQKYEDFLNTIIPDSAEFKENFVDVTAFRNYMDRKSIEKQRKQQKEIKRILSKIKFQKSEDRQKVLLDIRKGLVSAAKGHRQKTDGIGTAVEDVTEYLQHLKIDNSETTIDLISNDEDKVFKRLTVTRELGTDKDNSRISFSTQDSAQLMKLFILNDKWKENEKRKMEKEVKYREIVRHPYNENARIDSIVNTEGAFKYFYSQSVPADEHTKKMLLILSGEVEAIDNSIYKLPMRDTITYYVSSMVQFLDKSPRYRKKIIERRAEANMSAYINFPVGKDVVDEELDDNKKEISKICEMITKLTWSSEFEIDSITMTAASSPEGDFQANEKLAKRRALSLKNYFAMKLEDKEGVDTLLTARWIAEDWKKLAGYIVNDESIENKNGILEMIESIKPPDFREMQIRQRFKRDYEYLKLDVYPKLRVVDFKFNLHRAGMVKDTIHTTELDTEYAEALKMLENRKYKQALSILMDYDDYNTAICYMSLGYDEQAFKILEREKETSDRDYLIAILAARIGKEEDAVRYYLRSVELDEMKTYRGLLDPEINKLIKAYNLNLDRMN